ncbi:formate--tetrahydrofolate ligase [Haliangium sp.]|uniref:formate--tetrahydrofolate ligase n=1 Tax=Haliangium sp. TaxID=2663208 RepID=UPI003D0F067B
MPPRDIDIARQARLRPILDIGEALGIPAEQIYAYGPHKAKLGLDYVESLSRRQRAKLILVTAITPTAAGEGKTTTAIGLGDAFRRIGKRVAICLREPSLGPCFGMKGGAAGGGYAQVVPMEDINLHFTGDFHAVAAAHNLLAALVDNHLHWGNALDLDPRRIEWRRVLDISDRALRNLVTGLGGSAHGVPRESGFDITAASEVMAILCLARSRRDLHNRLADIVVGHTRADAPIRSATLEAAGAMEVLLRDALAPNLVQTMEHTPALVHGGPFANIAHGCNSVMATHAGLALADYVITEAGFGADLGAEKFFDIKCRQAGLSPDLAVVVATVRALKLHGGVPMRDLVQDNPSAVYAGAANLSRHIANLGKFGVPVVVAINRFSSDSDLEVAAAREIATQEGAIAVEATHWAQGSAGAEDLAWTVLEQLRTERANFAVLYPDELSLRKKIERIAVALYGAAGIATTSQAERRLDELELAGFGHLPVCMAKTQYSFSTDPARKGAPSGHTVTVREIRLAAGARFVVAICGDIMTMPGLPRAPAAHQIHMDEAGNIEGLF